MESYKKAELIGPCRCPKIVKHGELLESKKLDVGFQFWQLGGISDFNHQNKTSIIDN